MRDFTFEFPTRVISKLLGLPEEDLPWFRKRAVELISYTVKYKRAFEASAALKDYFLEQIEKRRSTPTEDIIGDLVSAEIDGEKLSDEAIYSFLRLLLPAGLETTYRSSGNLLYLLLTHPEQFEAVQADRELIGPAIEEGLRYETPLTTVQRFATEDTEVDGRRDPRRIGDRRLHRLGQPRRAALGALRGVRHLPEDAAAHIVCRRRAHLHGTAPGPDGDPGGRRVPPDRLSDIQLVTDDDPHIHGQPFRSPTAIPVTFSPATLLARPYPALSALAAAEWSWSPGTAGIPRCRTAGRRRCSCSRRTGRPRRRTFRR